LINWPVEITRTKYLTWYENLVAKAKSRPLPNGYIEQHHVIPVCLGGDNTPENIIALTAREHYIAHLLLWKMSMDKKSHNKMTMALHVMVNGSGNKKQNRSYLVPSRIYEANRKEYVKVVSEIMSGPTNVWKGRKHSEETIEKMKAWQNNPVIKQKQSERVTGEKNPMFGKKHSDEIKKQISSSSTSRWTDDLREEQSKRVKEKWQDPEYRTRLEASRKNSEAWLNRDWKASGAKAAATKMANGWKPSEESKKKVSETRKAKIASGEIVPWNKGKKCDHLAGENNSNSNTYRIIDPAGNVFVMNTRQKVLEFCKEQNIGYHSMLDLVRGKQGKNHLHLAGWQATQNKIRNNKS